MKPRLHGKVALISGAASGIGLATTEMFCREGAAVTLVDTQLTLAEEATFRLHRGGHRTLAIAADVTHTGQVRQAVEKTVHEYGRLDILFANAGIGYSGDLLKTTDEDWDQVMGVNARGVFICCREAVRQMLLQQPPGGAIVINGSISGLVGIPNQAPYAPSKGAVVEMTRQLAVEYARQNIRVNCVCPGTVDTPVLRRGMEMSGDPQAFLDMLIAGHPMGRIGRADEIAAAVLFLASDEASFITGAILVVDGGYTAR
ncbi:MAG TPA: glucose 1-dehydrogenase [Gemmataceae bacterium]|jgi:NAD(P)-dependent dehydrogenase (short-subunit alcohol dehydrogenase family)|nr:glucose 1-dehydrogenase [Gemmataceae bacterium]